MEENIYRKPIARYYNSVFTIHKTHALTHTQRTKEKMLISEFSYKLLYY